eukprot:6533219-Pyramimonas_sp.AAC.1
MKAPEQQNSRDEPLGRGGVDASACSLAPPGKGIARSSVDCLRHADTRRGKVPNVQNGGRSSSCHTRPCTMKPRPWGAQPAQDCAELSTLGPIDDLERGGGEGETGRVTTHARCSLGSAASAAGGSTVATATGESE